MIGSNVDPRHWADLDALCVDLRAHNVQSVRTVLKRESTPEKWLNAAHNRGLTVLAVLALESVEPFNTIAEAMAYYLQFPYDIIQWGNEMDVDCSADPDCASWHLSVDEYNTIISVGRDIAGPDRVLIGGGLAGGDEHWLDRVNIAKLNGNAAHPYTEDTIEKLNNFIIRYSKYGPLYITEYPNVEHTRHLNDSGVPSWHFCWGASMHPFYGIDHDPAKLAIFKEGAKTMPQFVLGFADYAAQHPEVGDPVENEWTERTSGGGAVQRQDTTDGILRYYQASNKSVFSPKD